jgi:hypothetical protein
VKLGIQTLEPGGVQPKKSWRAPGFSRRLDVGSEVSEPRGQLLDGVAYVLIGNGAGAKVESQRETGGISMSGTDPDSSSLFVDPEDECLRLLLGYDGRRIISPIGMLS